MPEVNIAIIAWRFRNGLDEIITIRRSSEPFLGQWCLPFGQIINSESIKTAISRHAKAQIGLEFSGHFFRVFDEIIPEQNIHNILIVYEGQVFDGKPKDGAAWITVHDALERGFCFTHDSILRAFRTTTKNVLIKDAMGILGVNDAAIDSWIATSFLHPYKNKYGQICIDERELKQIAHTHEAKEAYRNNFGLSVKRREDDIAEDKNGKFLDEIEKAIKEYRKRIIKLQEIHYSRNNRMNVFVDETPIVAAYVIFSKVIRLLNMGCDCLEKHHWDSLLLLRPLDEAMDLALYFIITAGTEKGQRHLSQWFRENASPPHLACRHEVSEYLQSNLRDDNKQKIQQEMARLYHYKSQFIHITHHDIMETFRAKLGKNVISLEGCEYGPCSYPRKIFQITQFFESQIWFAERRFFECFHDNLQLSKDDKNYLLSFDEPLSKSMSASEENSQNSFPDGKNDNKGKLSQPSMVDLIRQFRSGVAAN